MSDNQRDTKNIAEQALANLVERAKRMHMSSVTMVQQQTTEPTNPEEGCELNQTESTQKKSKNGSGSQRIPGSPVRKQRKLDSEPSPPPPSPREVCMMTELRDDYEETEQLVDQMLVEANVLSQEVIKGSQHQRDVNLVQEIELETTKRSVDTIFNAMSAEFERHDLKDILQRCYSALERTTERILSEKIPSMPHPEKPINTPLEIPAYSTNFNEDITNQQEKQMEKDEMEKPSENAETDESVDPSSEIECISSSAETNEDIKIDIEEGTQSMEIVEQEDE